MKKIFVLFVTALVLIPNVVTAQSAIMLSPAKSNFSAQPGDTVRATISLQNPNNKFTTVTVAAKDFQANSELNGEPEIIPTGSSPFSLANWLADANLNKKVTIPANQTVEYQAVFRIPKSASQKTYYGAITFTPDDPTVTPTAIGSLVFITVGNPPTSLSVSDLVYRLSDDATKPHGTFTATIHNSSDALSTPASKLKITNSEGKTVAEINQDGEGSVLPKSSRNYTFTLSEALPESMLTATVSTVDQNGTTADKTVQIDRSAPKTPSGDAPEQEGTFPWWAVVALAFLVSALVAGAFLIKKLHKQTTSEPPNTENNTESVLPTDKQ